MKQALVIDDSRTMRRIITKIMAELNYDVVEAEDGQEALTALNAMERPAVALVDWNMPVMNGLEFIETVRSKREYDLLRVVMVTSEVAIPKMMQALKAGADEFLMKPFTATAIEEKLTLVGLVPD